MLTLHDNTRIFAEPRSSVILTKADFLKALLFAFLTAMILFLASWAASAQGFKSIELLTPNPVVNNTAEKPQSKVWYHDGKWWAVFSVENGTFIWRLDGTSWSNALKISSSTSVEADCKVDNNVVHVFLWRKPNNDSQLVSVEYNASSKTYEPWSTRATTVFIKLDSGSETGTIDIDTKGRMWLASDGVEDIRMRWSDPPYSTWSDPLIIATGITDDDIGAVIALPVLGQIGVLWSDQNSKRFGFRTHPDGSAPTAWSANELPAAQSALDVGMGMADDHLNMAFASDGTLYCAVKTGYDTPGYPMIALLKRLPSGTWDPLHEVSQSGTRGIVLLNEAASTLKVVYTSQEDGGDILYRESPASGISFTAPLTLIEGTYNNATSTKNNYDANVVILASTETNLVGVRASDMAPVAVEESVPRKLAELYPNPAEDFVSLTFGERPGPGVFIFVSDLMGNVYPCEPFDTRGEKFEVNVGNLNIKPGHYFLMIRNDDKLEVLRFVKK